MLRMHLNTGHLNQQVSKTPLNFTVGMRFRSLCADIASGAEAAMRPPWQQKQQPLQQQSEPHSQQQR
jgi:hypothetical protein